MTYIDKKKKFSAISKSLLTKIDTMNSVKSRSRKYIALYKWSKKGLRRQEGKEKYRDKKIKRQRYN
jgi:hypothetical protein